MTTKILTSEEIRSLIRDAKRWRALIASDRIRVMGWAGFDESRKPKGSYQHMAVEFWNVHASKHPDPEFPQEACREQLTAYADEIIKVKNL